MINWFKTEHKYEMIISHFIQVQIYVFFKMLPKLEKEVLEWEQKYKSLTAIDDLKKKIDKLKEEMAWAFVIDKEKVRMLLWDLLLLKKQKYIFLL